jgi:hypothetical protein
MRNTLEKVDYIQKQLCNECMNQLEKLNNINYNHSFENGSLAISYMRCCGTKST